MALILRAIFYGAFIGAVLGVVLLAVSSFKGHSDSGTVNDAHGFVVLAVILIGAAFGGLLGLAASLGAYLKKKFEDESD
jgi:glycerol uptake facilitator-like aquaporin